MAQYFPAPAIASPMNGTGSVVHNPDDGDVQTRLPSICVDYLSHDWTEEDIWSSWRTMTRTKNEVANGVRLENASWRTWWKQRNKLKTISPETLNWLKDSDVTWLYGPLHTNVEAVPPPRISTTEDHLDLSSGKRAKPILKHRTISEILTGPNNERAQMGGSASPILESLYPEDEEDEFSETEGRSRPGLHQTRSDTNILRRSTGRRGNSPPRFQLPSMNISYAAATNPAGGAGSALTPFPGGATPSDTGDHGGREGRDGAKRHISFNTFVEQCISLSEPTSIPPDRPDSSSSEDGGIDSSDEDEHLEMRSTGSSSSSYAVRPSGSRQSSTEHFTIAHIAPALLKNNEVLPAPAPAIVYVPNAGSAAANNQDAGVQRKESIASSQARAEGDFPSPIDAAQWDEDDDEYDYFRGGQQGGSSSGPGRSSHGGRVGSVGHYEGKSTSQTSSANSSGTSTPTVRRGASVGSTTPPAYASVPSVQDKVGNSEVKIIRDTSSPASATNTSGTSSKDSSTPSTTPPSPNVSAGRSILRNKAGSSGGSGKSSSGDKAGSYFPPSTSTASSSGTATPEISRDEGIGAGGVFQAVSGPGNVPTAAPASPSPASTNTSSAATSSSLASTGGDDKVVSSPDVAPTRGRSVVRNSSATSLHDRPASRGTSSSGIPGSPISSTGGWPTSAPGGVTSPTGAVHPSTTPVTKASNSSAGAGPRGAKPPSINTQPATGKAGAQEPSFGEEDEDNGLSPRSPSGDNGMRIDDYWATHTQNEDQKDSNESKKHVPTAGPKDGQGGGEGVSHVEQEAKKGKLSIPGSGMVGDHFQKGDVGDVPKDEVATKREDNRSNREPEESDTVREQVDDDDDDDKKESQEVEADEDNEEGEGYKFMASTNPTPTSSPTIQMRPLPRSGQSTSASSLPHAHSAPKKPSPSSSSSAVPTLANASSSSSPPSSKGSGPSIDQRSSAFSAQNIASSSFSPGSGSAIGQGLGLGLGQSKKQDGQVTSPSGGGVVATARDLLGVLWGMGSGSENSGGKKP
ncbi:Protein of unknown function DUF1752, fungi [Phaffia rhodozyma]|uniref:Nitrogen regulatory protein areA GATA-like domain-containing protein n=1 Tax=Phaffia rhodozyma TaxID=264483 RepID=A0A0F7SKR6_PHARH|nr:Protein of unknown function DUF1752, fungi [Phaffia rhodozyma]